MRFSSKVIIGYVTVCLLTLAMAGLFLFTFNRYQRSNHMIFLLEKVHSREQALQVALYVELQSIRALLQSPDIDHARKVQENMAKVRGLIEEVRAMEESLASRFDEPVFPREKLLYFARLQEDLKKFDSAFSEIHAALIAPSGLNSPDAAALADRFELKLESWAAGMTEAWNHDIARTIAGIEEEKKGTAFILMALVAVNVGVSLVLSIILVTSLHRVMGRLAAGMRRVASGNYAQPVHSCPDPEMNYLVENFNRMTEELRQLEEMRGDFISMLTHDMKSPLTVIKMFSGMLLERGEGDHRMAETISRNADRMLHMVDNFLDFSKSESVAMKPVLRPVSLDTIISRVLADSEILAKSRRVTLSSSLPPGPSLVSADEEKLERLFHNLVTNAIKYNREGGGVELRAERDGGRVRVAVEDTGIGIAEKDRNSLFVKYSRSDRTRHIKGTGLGLVVCREIVRAHGGELRFTSTEGKGTVFTFDLPAADEDGQDTGREEEIALSRAGRIRST
jgi:signal transduction histidine kinase